MARASAEARRLLSVLADRGIFLEVASYNRAHKVIPAGGCYFSASSDAFRAESWAEIAAYLSGLVDGLEFVQGKTP